MKKEYQANVNLLFFVSHLAQKPFTAQKKGYIQLYGSPHPLPFSSMAENTFTLLRDQPEQTKKPRAAPQPLFGLG